MTLLDSADNGDGSQLATINQRSASRVDHRSVDGGRGGQRNAVQDSAVLIAPQSGECQHGDGADSSPPRPVPAEQAFEQAAIRARLESISVSAARPSIAVRLLEIAISGFAITVFLPVMAVVALIIRRGSPGPAVFWQTRVGVGLKPFTFCKFRTLYADAKERFPELYAYRYGSDELESLKFKVVDDPRVTPEGVWLRKSSLDELPNFWNVLTGKMALVGPRPEIPEMLPYYEGDMLRKFSVRPGITGLAQVSGRGNLSFFDTVDFDLQYVDERSFWLDVKILFCTLYRIVRRDGAF